MPTASPFLTVEYTPSNPKLKPTEQKRQIALQALSDLTGLGKLTANLSAARIAEGCKADEIDRRVEAFDAGLHVLGHLIAAVADTAFFAVDGIGKKAES